MKENLPEREIRGGINLWLLKEKLMREYDQREKRRSTLSNRNKMVKKYKVHEEGEK